MIERVLYVAGPMTGYPEFNWPAFRAASAQLWELGYQVRCPTESGATFEMSWEECSRLGLKVLIDCNGVALLPNWHLSRGVKREVAVARALGMPVMLLHWWLRGPAHAEEFFAMKTQRRAPQLRAYDG